MKAERGLISEGGRPALCHQQVGGFVTIGGTQGENLPLITGQVTKERIDGIPFFTTTGVCGVNGHRKATSGSQQFERLLQCSKG